MEFHRGTLVAEVHSADPTPSGQGASTRRPAPPGAARDALDALDHHRHKREQQRDGFARAAINSANLSEPNTIQFNITGSTTIDLTSALPNITKNVFIDGASQGGTGYSGPPLIVLNGAGITGSANGLDFASGSAGSEVQGLVIQKFGGDGILINGTSGNLIVGNYIGTDVNGTAKLGNRDGVTIENGATANTVGGTSSGAANVISGNGGYGVYLTGSGTSGNVVLGNLIGTDVNGTANLGNTDAGVLIGNGATGNTVGGTTSTAVDVISDNGTGVGLTGSGTSGNVVLGNLIGTDVNGTANLGNVDGVVIKAARRPTRWAARSAALPTSSPATATACIWVSAGRVATWCWATSSAPTSTAPSSSATATVWSSRRARRPTRWAARSAALPTSSPATPTACIWVLAGRVATWCWATSSAPTSTAPSSSATATACSSRRRDGQHGGRHDQRAANVISGNSRGVVLEDSGTSGNVVQGNLIGTDINGTANLGNSITGVDIFFGATANTVGGTISGAANVISGNGFIGVYLDNSGTSGNVVLGNLIGTDINGTAILGNTFYGVLITNSATANTVGGSAAGANVISGNTGAGVAIDGAVSSNTVSFNSIGTNKAQTAALANGVGLLFNESSDTIGAGSAADPSVNTIAGNTTELQLAGNNNVLLGLSIGPTAKTLGLPNGTGVFVTGNSNTVGGTTAAARNVISGKQRLGVMIQGSANVVEGDYIGTDSTGTVILGK